MNDDNAGEVSGATPDETGGAAGSGSDELVDPIDALGDLPAAVGVGGVPAEQIEPQRARTETGGRHGIGFYLAMGALFGALTVGVMLISSGNDTDTPAKPEQAEQVNGGGGPTDATPIELDDTVAAPEPAIIEELRWADGATIEAALFVDNCTAVHSIDAELGAADTVVVTVTTGTPASREADCGDPTLRSVTLEVDRAWAGTELVDVSSVSGSAPAANTEGTP